MIHRHHTRALAAAAALATLALVLAACSSASQASTSSQEATASGGIPAAVTQAVDAAYAGTSGEVPGDSAPLAQGKKVWIVSAFQQVSGLAHLAAEAQAASKTIGWDSTVCDGLNNANGAWATCVRQAIADGADAIILEAIDCAPVRQALLEAKAAGILIAAANSFDCNDPSQGGAEALFDATPTYADGVDSTADYYRQSGALRADAVIAHSGGTAQVLHVEFSGVAFGGYLSEGFTKEFATCGGCAIVDTLSITPPDIPQIRQKFETTYIKAAKADTVVVDVDFFFAAGIQPALAAAGRTDVTVAGGECAIESLDFIRAGGGQQTCIGTSLGRIGWSLIDQLNRVFAKEPLAKDGIGWQLVDATHNLPAAGTQYDGDTDYAAAYTASWQAADKP
ncbi:substrate-binding domain-containing protein [uncultured Microbacterium sp.]|uniref:substrate-binding domain-containing protein n=1 Tax=uncultured Microbacterium sp. TaxID=191216 RepID=UPI0035C9DD16